MLSVSNVSKRFGDNLILDSVSFVLNPGERLGLIGPNGCGKTTLLRILAGKDTPDSGAVRRDPDLRAGYLEQGLTYDPGDTLRDSLPLDSGQVQERETRLACLAEDLARAEEDDLAQVTHSYNKALADLQDTLAAQRSAHEALAVLAGLGLGHFSLDAPVATLSGGQKTRLGLARVLLSDPELLLLDEPTNHLDIDALEWLEKWLASYRGAALIVSHDRAFLDATVSGILDLDPQSHAITQYPGSFSAYIEVWESSRGRQWARWRDQQAEIRRIRQDIARTKEQAQGVERATTPGEPGVRRIAKKVARKAISREKKLERYLDSGERVERPRESWQMRLEFAARATGQDVLALDGLAAGYGGAPLFAGVDQTIRARERIALVGPNGSGKSTLLKVISGRLAPMEGRIRLGANVRLGYLPQEQEELDGDTTAFEAIRQAATLSMTDARSFLHVFLFEGDDVFVPFAKLSYGERARLLLARLVASGCNLLLLDEPINHLDIPSRAQFERALAEFEGTVLAVVHDRYFVRRFASRVWLLQDGTAHSFCDLDEIQRVRSISSREARVGRAS